MAMMSEFPQIQPFFCDFYKRLWAVGEAHEELRQSVIEWQQGVMMMATEWMVTQRLQRRSKVRYQVKTTQLAKCRHRHQVERHAEHDRRSLSSQITTTIFLIKSVACMLRNVCRSG